MVILQQILECLLGRRKIGQDDIAWYTTTKITRNGFANCYKRSVHASSHNGETGTYNTHVYLFTDGSASSCLNNSMITLTSSNTSTGTYTARNLIPDGNFENYSMGWHSEGDGISDWGNRSAGYGINGNSCWDSKALYYIDNGNQSFLRHVFSTSNLSGHVLYGKVSMYRLETTVTPGLYVFTGKESGTAWPSMTDGGAVWYDKEVSASTLGWLDTVSIMFKANYDNLGIMLAQSNGNGSGTVAFDGLMVVDLTACFGAGQEPSQKWCDQQFNDYFDTTKTVRY